MIVKPTIHTISQQITMISRAHTILFCKVLARTITKCNEYFVCERLIDKIRMSHIAASAATATFKNQATVPFSLQLAWFTFIVPLFTDILIIYQKQRWMLKSAIYLEIGSHNVQFHYALYFSLNMRRTIEDEF